MTITVEPNTFTNWSENLRCEPASIVKPSSEDAVIEVLAAVQGGKARIVGAGHSFSPIHTTEHTLISLDNLAGISSIDSAAQRVVCGPGTRIRDFGDPLWKAGLVLKNQGDIDKQHIVGAISTATHGSGLRIPSFASAGRRFRLVTPSGEVLNVDESDPDLLAATQVSLGMLGVITEVELEVRESFALAERLEFWSLEEVLGRWDEENANRRHFSFFWMPASDSPDRLFMEYPEGMDMADRSRVKLYDELPADVLDGDVEAVIAEQNLTRLDRPYRIYPDPEFQGEIMMRELEYMVPYEQGKDAFLALRELCLNEYPENKYPIETRFIAGEDAWLSPFYGRDSVSISICGHKPQDFMKFLKDVAAVLDPFDPRPHWGKIFFMDRERVAAAFPRYADFVEIRRRLDPDGVLLNDELARLFS
jgi:FAD/FMN-containing dehydrogenase